MKELILIIILNLLICRCYGVIYKLNDSEYSRMPPVFHLDDYDYCVTDPEGVYCAVEIDVVSDTTNELYTMMRNYTEYDTKHFNHTLLRHGICVTQTCKKFVRRNKTDTAVDKHKRNSEDIKLLLEECLNESLWNNYELKCRITVPPYCNEKDDPGSDAGDLVMGVFLLVLLTMNVIGSLYDVIAVRGKNKKGNGLLLCFSVPHNFSRLINPFAHFGPREQRLKALHGLRAITMICVISCHSLLPFGIAPENAHYVEALYDNLAYYIFLNGMIVVQTFFIISGCLLSYKLELYAEKREIKWTLLPKTLIVNWAKLTPSYMVVLAFTVTWMRYTGSGPLWEISAIKEIEDCQMNGWKHALYINNYFDHTQCLAHTWYLAANMQLIILGYTTCILVKRGKFRTTAIIFLFIVGILTPIAHTYFQGLDPVLMVNPESARYFMDNPTFNHVYKRGHTNIVNFILGIALGSLIYHLQKNGVDIQMKYKKYRYLFLLTFPAIFATILIGSVFYQEDTYISIYLKSIYAGLIKPAYGIVLAILIIGCVFKIENVYRPILEWSGWKVPGKLSYCAFLLHLTLVRVATGRLKTLIPTDNLRIIEIMFAYIVMSYLMAIPLWLLVDAPLTEFLLKLLNGRLFQRTKGTKIISDNDTALQISMIMTDTGEGNAGL